MEGILLARGPWVRQGKTLHGAQIVDLAPTVLHYLQMPVPAEMDGKVLDIFDPAFIEARPVQYVNRRTTGASPLDDAGLSAEEEEQIKLHLERLGYL